MIKQGTKCINNCTAKICCIVFKIIIKDKGIQNENFEFYKCTEINFT